MTVGALPRTQLSTQVPLDLLGIANGSAKVNLLRLGPFDLGAEGTHYRLRLGEFLGFQTAWTGAVSVRILEPWSFHVAGTWSTYGADGLPDLADLSPAITALTGENVRDWDISQLAGQDATLHARAQALSFRVATDVRVNRRDSVILQGQARLWGSVLTDVDLDLPPILGLDTVLSQDESGTVALRDSYVASVAWQFSWRRADLRVGVGASSFPGAWLLQTTELSWRFGGRTRAEERRMRQGWRHNKKELRLAQVRTGPAEEAPRR